MQRKRILHAVHKATIWPQSKLLHNIIQGNKLPNICKKTILHCSETKETNPPHPKWKKKTSQAKNSTYPWPQDSQNFLQRDLGSQYELSAAWFHSVDTN